MSQPASRYRNLCALPLLLATLLTAACSEDPAQVPTQPEPVPVTVTFDGTLTVNGSAVHVFTVERAGGVTAQMIEASIDNVTIGMSLGTWNGVACQLIIASAAAKEGDLIAGTAQTVGNFCLYLNDNGTLAAPVDYTIQVVHF